VNPLRVRRPPRPRATLLGWLLVASAVLALVVSVLLGPVATTASGGAALGASTPGLTLASSSSGADWPMYLQNPSRTSANLAETSISTGNAKSLSTEWSYATRSTISGSTTIVGTTAYVGAWNGYEYAFNAATGKLIWKTFLGIAKTTNCGDQGIAASASVAGGVLYIGGGDGYFYALNAATGAVEWKVLVGNPANGYYNWASPLLYDGFAYVGVSSFCDMPLVPGGLLEVNLSTQATQMFHTTPPGGLGSSVWGSPSVDPATNTIYFATGNAKLGETGQLADAVVAINATTLALVSDWEIPASQQVVDGDFGSSATLFTTSNGTTMVGALDKNGVFYAFYAAHLATGPAWSYKITTGQSVGSAAFGGGLVYVAGGTETYKGTKSSGAAFAFNPNNGAVVWEQPLWGKSVSAPAYANGVLYVDGGSHLFVLNAATGAKIKEFGCGGTFYSPPAIAHGQVYTACTDGHEYAYALPGAGITAPPASSGGFAPSDGLGPIARLRPAATNPF
jgi:outer membrane protein assembly factor BamB